MQAVFLPLSGRPTALAQSCKSTAVDITGLLRCSTPAAEHRRSIFLLKLCIIFLALGPPIKMPFLSKKPAMSKRMSATEDLATPVKRRKLGPGHPDLKDTPVKTAPQPKAVARSPPLKTWAQPTALARSPPLKLSDGTDLEDVLREYGMVNTYEKTMRTLAKESPSVAQWVATKFVWLRGGRTEWWLEKSCSARAKAD